MTEKVAVIINFNKEDQKHLEFLFYENYLDKN